MGRCGGVTPSGGRACFDAAAAATTRVLQNTPWRHRVRATIHVIWRAAIDGLVSHGADRAGESTFVLFYDWVAITGLSRAVPVGALARPYQAAYGPTAREDFAEWSDLGHKVIDRA